MPAAFFGATALATTPVRVAARGDTGVLAQLTPALFLLANVVVGVVAVGTVYRALQGRLLPPPAIEIVGNGRPRHLGPWPSLPGQNAQLARKTPAWLW